MIDASLGCILLGERFDPVKNTIGVTCSGEAFNEFMTRLKGVDKFKLIILDAMQLVNQKEAV